MEYLICTIPVKHFRVGNDSEFKSPDNLLSRISYIASTVSVRGSDKIDIETRLSEVSRDSAVLILEGEVSEYFNRILPPTKCIDTPIADYISESTYMKRMFRFDPVKVLRYLPGCFFKCHTDTRKGLDHQLTLLIFPPLKNYEGGELILHTSDGDINVEEHRNPTEWTMVLFRPDVPHEVTPLTSGVRYVFKTAFFSDEYTGNVDKIINSKPLDGKKLRKKLESFVDEFDSNQYRTDRTYGWDSEDSDSSYESKIKDAFEVKLKKLLQTSLDKSLNTVPTNDSIFTTMSKRGIYVMTRLYPGAIDETDLIGPHRQLYLDLKEKYRLVKLLTATFTRNVGEVTSLKSIIKISHDLREWGSLFKLNDEYFYSEETFDIFYESSPFGPHKFRTEYNDSTYDLETTVYTTIIIFMSPKN